MKSMINLGAIEKLPGFTVLAYHMLFFGSHIQLGGLIRMVRTKKGNLQGSIVHTSFYTKIQSLIPSYEQVLSVTGWYLPF